MLLHPRLPTIDLIGDIDSLTSSAVRLENGDYKVVKYTESSTSNSKFSHVNKSSFSTRQDFGHFVESFPSASAQTPEKMKNLRSLSVINSKLTELPIRLSELPEVRDVEISGNEIVHDFLRY